MLLPQPRPRPDHPALAAQPGADLAPDSLLRIPLVDMMLRDPCVGFATRAIDASWHYLQILPTALAGFNPAAGKVFVPARSRIAAWLDAPAEGARLHNDADRLLREVLFAVHDYLHIWAYRVIRERLPDLPFDRTDAEGIDFEDRIFCHLLTEAVAVAGLDYWYLSCVELNDVVDLGTAIRNLTIPYHERQRAEVRRFCPSLEVQSPAFFQTLVEIYCGGTFPGFDPAALRQSPLVLEWVHKELQYGRLQREYSRQWFGYLLDRRADESSAQLRRPCEYDKPWQVALTQELGELLWNKVKHGRMNTFSAASAQGDDGYRRIPGRLDFRFVNARCVDLDDDRVMARADGNPESTRWLLRQLVSSYQLDDAVDRRAIEQALATGNLAIVRALLRHANRLDTADGGPPLLFFLS
jgi:hypothetical protein